MVFCNNCGNPVENGSVFCAECGAPVSTAVPTPPQPTFQQPTPPVYYPPQPSYPPYAPKRNTGSQAKTFGIIAMIMLGAALLLDIVGIFDMHKNYPQNRITDLLVSSFTGMVLPLVISLFIPQVTFILVQTQSNKAAKPFMIVVICMLALQILSAVYAFIHYQNIINGADTGINYLYSLANSVKGSGILVAPYNFSMALTKANRVNTCQLFFTLADALYILKNVMSILSLRKLSRR